MVDVEQAFDDDTRRIRPERLLDALGILKYHDRNDFFTRSDGQGRLWKPFHDETIQLDISECEFVPPAVRKCVGEFRFPPIFTKEVTNCTLVGPGALAVTADNYAILETTDNSDFTLYKPNNASHLRRDYWKFLRSKRNPRKTLDNGPYALLASRWADNYYHWLLDYLPQLRAFEHYQQKTDEQLTLILNRSPPRWVVDSLKLLGYDSNDWIEWLDGIAVVDRLVVSSHTRYSVLPSIDAAKWVSSELCTSLDVNNNCQKNDGSRIYISRKDADTRRIVNESELIAALKTMNIEKYVLSELTFEQQIKLFSNAELIIAPHGAGLVNMLFSNSTQILEIMGSHTSPCYFCLARGLGHEYTCIKAQPQDHDMIVDPDIILNKIHK